MKDALAGKCPFCLQRQRRETPATRVAMRRLLPRRLEMLMAWVAANLSTFTPKARGK